MKTMGANIRFGGGPARYLAASTAALIGTASAQTPPAGAPAAGTTYTVQAGDTCVSVAARAYGSRARVDLLHRANPSLGPVPHHLKPGTVLRLPNPTGDASAADARLERVHNTVRIETPVERVGRPNEPLYRGNRVATDVSSGADVTFLDESQLRLGERTLIVILGDSKSRVRDVPVATRLVTGGLTAKLAELRSHQLVTDSADALVRGTARVHVDRQKRTTLSALKRSSRLTAEKKTVDVPEGYGSYVEQGKPPTEPRVLPAPPTWRREWPALVLVRQGDAPRVELDLASGQASVRGFRVQLAADEGFRTLLWDFERPATPASSVSQPLRTGRLYARAASVDDAFTGDYGPPIQTTLATYTLGPDGETVLVDDPAVHCVRSTTAREVRCALDGDAHPVIVPLPPAVSRVQPQPSPHEPAPTRARGRGRELEVGLSGGVASAWKLQNPGVRVEATVGYGIPLGPGRAVLGIAVAGEDYPRANRGDTFRDGLRVIRAATSHVDMALGLPLSYRFDWLDAHVSPTVQVQPELILQHVTFGSESFEAAMVALRGSAGVQVRFGKWAGNAEGGYRYSSTPRTGAPFRGPMFILGVRRFF